MFFEGDASLHTCHLGVANDFPSLGSYEELEEGLRQESCELMEFESRT